MSFFSRAYRTLSSLSALTIYTFYGFGGIGNLSYNGRGLTSLRRFQLDDDDDDDDDRRLFINILSNATVAHLTHLAYTKCNTA